MVFLNSFIELNLEYPWKDSINSIQLHKFYPYLMGLYYI